MIDHFTLTVPEMARAKDFYTRALAPLGYSVLMDFGEMVGFGDRKPYFWLKSGPNGSQPMHMAFEARSRKAVDEFHAAALEAGARDDGAPGLRKDYHPNYYAAFVVEVNGHPIEAVCHLAPAAASERKAARKSPAPKRAGKVRAKKAAGKRKAASRKRR